MSRTGKFAIIVSAIWFVVFTVYAAHRHSIILQLLSLLVSLAFVVAVIVSIVCIFAGWRQRRWQAVLPFAICALSVVTSDVLVRAIRQAIFENCLPSYETVVQQMETGGIPVSTNWGRIPQAEPEARLVWGVYGRKDTNGAWIVEFMTEGGFPVSHSGYMYVSSGTVKPGSEEASRWFITPEKEPKWFYITD